MTKRYFDDLPAGFRFETDAQRLTLDEILDFARQWDPQPFHTDAAAAADSPFGGIIASGFHTMLVGFVLTLKAGVWNAASMGSPGMDAIRWLKPVRPDDELHVVAEVMSSTPSRSKPDRGATVIRYDVLRGDGETVMSYTATHILRRRPA
ncbi:MaoC family dehydratase [Aestuariicoccus sp. MJ-SS9]|uniref:MaoC family dehydratase n=1 Tax=Aestuariicoccus sp. MJ-SS9 TaxID=3079855 RepID=UPI0029157A6F|nr:MaoC family dehydratase [Aestuariicoccus sp. MJ-SS9]MDU8912007.1 MaoC family dehydratase [Aestuariicoccus sp. MJ-SS9]